MVGETKAAKYTKYKLIIYLNNPKRNKQSHRRTNN